MSRPLDYNGFAVSKSEPKKVLKTVKRTLLIDSADRDTSKYYTNGDFVVYLPRVYENVVSMRLVAAEFPPVFKVTNGAVTHQYTDSSNGTTGFKATNDVAVAVNTAYYFLVDVEGMNKTDECAVGGTKSTFPDGFYAKIPALASSYGGQTFIEYNDHSAQENIARYSPSIGKLDRLHIRTRLHNQKDTNIGFVYWTTDGAVASGSNQKGAEFNLTLEIEMLDNVFDEFSSFETHLRI